MPELPDVSIKELVDDFKLTLKDAKTLIVLDDGRRLAYFDKVLALLVKRLQDPKFAGTPIQCLSDHSITKAEKAKHARLVANWYVPFEPLMQGLPANLLHRVIHELGGVMSTSGKPIREMGGPRIMASILLALVQNRITGQSAKMVLQDKCGSDVSTQHIEAAIKDVEIQKLSTEEYRAMAQSLIDANQTMAEKVLRGESGKLMWFVGQMIRQGKGSVEADKAKAVLEELLSNNSL